MNLWFGAQFRPPADGEAPPDQAPDFRSGVFHVSKHQGLFLAGRHAGREDPPAESFLAEIAFFHHALGSRREILVDLFDKGPGITVVHTPCAVGTGGHAEPASDAAVVVHRDDSIGPPEGGLRGTDPDAGRVVAVIAENGQGAVPHLLRHLGNRFSMKYFLAGFEFYPIDLILGVAEIGDIMREMTGVDAIPAAG